jgi:hypothetical protein
LHPLRQLALGECGVGRVQKNPTQQFSRTHALPATCALDRVRRNERWLKLVKRRRVGRLSDLSRRTMQGHEVLPRSRREQALGEDLGAARGDHSCRKVKIILPSTARRASSASSAAAC